MTAEGPLLHLWDPRDERLSGDMEDSRAVSLRLLRFVGTEGKERWGNKWRTDPAYLRVCSPFPVL